MKFGTTISTVITNIIIPYLRHLCEYCVLNHMIYELFSCIFNELQDIDWRQCDTEIIMQFQEYKRMNFRCLMCYKINEPLE